MCVHIFFNSVLGAEWPPFVKKLLIRLTICSFCIFTICNFSYFPLGFESWICALIASVPDLCIHFTIRILLKIIYAYALVYDNERSMEFGSVS